VLAKVEELEKMAVVWVKGPKSDIKCSNCTGMGHLAADCFRKGGGKEGQYPSWWKGKKDTKTTTLASWFKLVRFLHISLGLGLNHLNYHPSKLV
jgi:hypothetical protein